jgi:hypothetical protein
VGNSIANIAAAAEIKNDGARRAELVTDDIEPSLAERDVTLNVRRQHRGEHQLIERVSDQQARHIIFAWRWSGRPSQNLLTTTWEPTLPLPRRDRSPGQTLGPGPARAPSTLFSCVCCWTASLGTPLE